MQIQRSRQQKEVCNLDVTANYGCRKLNYLVNQKQRFMQEIETLVMIS